MKKINPILLLILLLGACAPLQTATPTEASASAFTPTSTPTLSPPPFSKEVLDSFGEVYYYKESLGLVYKNSDGTERLVMKLNDTRTAWVDDESFTEFPLDAYKPVLVNGIEPDGRPLKIIHTRVIGEGAVKHTEIYIPKTGEWRNIVGYEPGLTTDTDISKWNVVTINDVVSGFLRELKLSRQYKWQKNAVNPNWYVSFVGGSRSGAMELTPFGDGFNEYKDKIFPTSPVDMYWIQSPSDPTKKIGLGLSQHKGPNGEDIVFATAFGDEQVNRGGIPGYLGENNASLTYLIGEDNHDCANASLIVNSSAALIKEACVFWPTTDSRWDRVSWDFILNGAEFGTKYVSDPLTTKFVAQYQDNVMISLLGYQ